MPAPRKSPDELRERAVREVRTTGRPIAHVAKEIVSLVVVLAINR
ncbi:hypothetical protein ABZ656_54585 [Streptomyces sp. NPDC007095]|jgi:transposase